jgi:BMFP domain-containing protein YqiC
MDAKVFGQEIAAMVREHVARRIEPLERRIAELEAQDAAKPKSARDKK